MECGPRKDDDWRKEVEDERRLTKQGVRDLNPKGYNANKEPSEDRQRQAAQRETDYYFPPSEQKRPWEECEKCGGEMEPGGSDASVGLADCNTWRCCRCGHTIPEMGSWRLGE